MHLMQKKLDAPGKGDTSRMRWEWLSKWRSTLVEAKWGGDVIGEFLRGKQKRE